MKRQSLVLLAVAVLSAGAAGCFKDPTSSLRSGPAFVRMQYSVVHMAVGDSLTFTASVLDNQGNTMPATGATVASASTTVARAGADNSLIMPDNYQVRAYIRGVAAGTTTVTVTARGVSGKASVTVQ